MDDEANAHVALPDRDLCEVLKSQHVRCGSSQTVIYAGERTHRVSDRFDTNDMQKPNSCWQGCNGAAGGTEAFMLHLTSNSPLT